MNKQRRKILSSCETQLMDASINLAIAMDMATEECKILNAIYNIKQIIEDTLEIIVNVKEEESDVFEKLPENLQYTSRAERSEEIIDLLEEYEEMAESLVDNIKDIIGNYKPHESEQTNNSEIVSKIEALKKDIIFYKKCIEPRQKILEYDNDLSNEQIEYYKNDIKLYENEIIKLEKEINNILKSTGTSLDIVLCTMDKCDAIIDLKYDFEKMVDILVESTF